MTAPKTGAPIQPTNQPTNQPPLATVTSDDVVGMKTARTGGVVRAGAVMAVATLVSRLTGFLSKVVILSVLGFGIVYAIGTARAWRALSHKESLA